MIKIKCSKCGSIIWVTEHEERDYLDLSQIASGEYFQHFCPRCEQKRYCFKSPEEKKKKV